MGFRALGVQPCGSKILGVLVVFRLGLSTIFATSTLSYSRPVPLAGPTFLNMLDMPSISRGWVGWGEGGYDVLSLSMVACDLPLVDAAMLLLSATLNGGICMVLVAAGHSCPDAGGGGAVWGNDVLFLSMVACDLPLVDAAYCIYSSEHVPQPCQHFPHLHQTQEKCGRGVPWREASFSTQTSSENRLRA